MSQDDKTVKEKAEDSAKPSIRADRRKVLTGMTVGTAASVGAVTQGRWAKPVVESVVLPAHAQTTAEEVQGTFTAELVFTGDDDPDERFVFNDGTHTLDQGQFADYQWDDPIWQFQARIDPAPSTDVEVTLDISADTDLDFGDINDRTHKEKVNLPDEPHKSAIANFPELEADDSPDDVSTVTATFSAPGYPTRRITLVLPGYVG